MKIKLKLILLGAIVSSGIFAMMPSFLGKNIALAQRSCSDGFECFELALKELEQAKKEIQALEKRLEDRFQETESKASAAQNTADTAMSNATSAQATANTAVSNAASAQATATNSLNKANTAQTQANQALTRIGVVEGKVKHISIGSDDNTVIDAGKNVFVIQQDGNIVIYRKGVGAIWATNTN